MSSRRTIQTAARVPFRAAVLAALLVAAGPARGWARGQSEPETIEVEPVYTVAIVYPLTHPFFDPVTEHAIDYGAQHSVRVIARAPARGSAREQIEIMESLIAQRVDGIALCAVDAEKLAPYVDAAIERGIPTIAFESDIPGSKRICFMGTDNYRAGEHLARVLARVLNERGKVLIHTGLSSQTSVAQRVQGIRDTLGRNYPFIDIVDERSGEGDPALTRAAIEAQIREFPDFDALLCVDATAGPIAAAIWKSLGWSSRDRAVITFDDTSESIEGLRDGVVSAVVSQTQWTWGPLIVDRLLALVRGEQVSGYLDTGTIEITSQNVGMYRMFRMFPGSGR